MFSCKPLIVTIMQLFLKYFTDLVNLRGEHCHIFQTYMWRTRSLAFIFWQCVPIHKNYIWVCAPNHRNQIWSCALHAKYFGIQMLSHVNACVPKKILLPSVFRAVNQKGTLQHSIFRSKKHTLPSYNKNFNYCLVANQICFCAFLILPGQA